MTIKKRCHHPRYSFQMHVCSFKDSDLQCLEIYAQCIECGEPVVFHGLAAGPDRDRPSTTPNRNHAFIPFLIAPPEPLRH